MFLFLVSDGHRFLSSGLPLTWFMQSTYGENCVPDISKICDVNRVRWQRISIQPFFPRPLSTSFPIDDNNWTPSLTDGKKGFFWNLIRQLNYYIAFVVVVTLRIVIVSFKRVLLAIFFRARLLFHCQSIYFAASFGIYFSFLSIPGWLEPFLITGSPF